MKNHEQYDGVEDFELENEYDFSEAVRGRFYKPHKVEATLNLDDDVFLFLKKKAAEEHLDFHSLVNHLLRKSLRKPSAS
ncbi:hypothetical protein [Marinospirillum insulare]|uniref:BrnA antitoxin of type II toxin-antitoxin system n=1 Tax=Marinospirillum insulare TaxID=217169 RepID=A0ABQ5ZZU2_9GAMM|nr:hypothetical protein [Marinospirillum insulare]GLR63404.1 hypothetical protein GCM10007878_08390 [Marinospirillum insulare]